MKFSEYAGNIQIDTSHLKSFVCSWFNQTDNVVIVAISVDSPRRKVLSQTVTALDVYNMTDKEIESLCSTEDGEMFNTYLSIFPVKDDNNVSLHSRGTKEDIEQVYGVFADLDVKEGSFSSKTEIKQFLQSLDLEPTIVVDNGSTGGIHAYWRFTEGQTAEEEILYRWWCYLDSKTDNNVDRLIDMTRISRMPSGIYWAKDSTYSDTVKVIYTNGPRHSLESVEKVSNEAFEARKKRISDTLIKRDKSRMEIGSLAKEIFANYTGNGFSWSERLAIAKLEDIINEKFDWEEILIPHGWKFRRNLKDGAKEWARPGQKLRSAVTDYRHEDGSVSPVMSLLSMSEDTLLSDLKEAEIPLSKYRVLLRLEYKDNERAMLIGVRDRVLKK